MPACFTRALRHSNFENAPNILLGHRPCKKKKRSALSFAAFILPKSLSGGDASDVLQTEYGRQRSVKMLDQPRLCHLKHRLLATWSTNMILD